MNLVIIDPERKANGATKICSVRITKKGCITFSARLAEIMNFAEIGTISFVQDSDHKKDWYLKRVGKLNVKKQKSGSFTGHASSITGKIFESLKISEKKNTTFEVSEEFTPFNGEHYFGLLTSKAL